MSLDEMVGYEENSKRMTETVNIQTVRCQKMADCGSQCKKADSHAGKCWHCGVNDA